MALQIAIRGSDTVMKWDLIEESHAPEGSTPTSHHHDIERCQSTQSGSVLLQTNQNVESCRFYLQNFFKVSGSCYPACQVLFYI